MSYFELFAQANGVGTGTVRTVVWEDGGSNPASYPIWISHNACIANCSQINPAQQKGFDP
jgi:hypothetical protein